jgi:ribosome recycling factor
MSMIDDVFKELRDSNTKAHEALKRELAKVRTGRANSAMLENVRVDYYGASTPLAQMSSISVPEPRLLTVKPWDKTALKAVEKAIRESELGFNPQIDGDIIRVPIPALTEERRKEMVKLAKKHGEESKVAIRNARRDALEMLSELAKDGEASEDEVDRAKKKAEEIVAEGTKKVDELVSNKEKDVLDVG